MDLLVVGHPVGRVPLPSLIGEKTFLDGFIGHGLGFVPGQIVNPASPFYVCHCVARNTACQCCVSLAESLRHYAQDFLVVRHNNMTLYNIVPVGTR